MKQLQNYLFNSKIVSEENKEGVKVNSTKLVLEKIVSAKTFEKIGLPHKLDKENIVITENVLSIIKTFSIKEKKVSNSNDVLAYLSEVSNLIIRDKAGSFIGGRMGRPEQAKARQMKGNPHVLFPIGLKGGSTRNINKAIDDNYNEGGKVKVEVSEYFCPTCKKFLLIIFAKM